MSWHTVGDGPIAHDPVAVAVDRRHELAVRHVAVEVPEGLVVHHEPVVVPQPPAQRCALVAHAPVDQLDDADEVGAQREEVRLVVLRLCIDIGQRNVDGGAGPGGRRKKARTIPSVASRKYTAAHACSRRLNTSACIFV